MPAALDRSYDGIIIGAGHHGLVLGSYMARQGLDILLVDRRMQYGGALVTEEATASPTSRRATSSASRISTARRWCSGATWRRRSPMWRASPSATRRPSAI